MVQTFFPAPGAGACRFSGDLDLSKLSRIALGAVVFCLGMGLLHARLNLGFDPLRSLGLRKAEEDTRFRVGFLPVT